MSSDTPPPFSGTSPESLYLSHRSYVFSVALHLLGNPHDADDVTQTVFLRVLKYLPFFRGDSDVRTWLYRVTVNEVVMLKRKKLRRTHPLSVDPSLFGKWLNARIVINSDNDGPHTTLCRREVSLRVRSAVEGLPPPLRDAVVLADLCEMSNAEVATRLGISVAATKSRLHRAMALLRWRLSCLVD